MRDPRLEKLADIVINYSVEIQPEEFLMIRSRIGGAPLVRELYRAALRAGGFVTTNIELPGLDKIFFDEANEAQQKWISPMAQILAERYDAYVTVKAEHNTKEGTKFDPQKRATVGAAMQPVQRIFLQRMATRDIKWCGVQFPTAAHAQDAHMALEDYEDFVYGAVLPDIDDPIGFWRGMDARQSRLVAQLNQVERVRLVAEDTDLTVKVGGRKWLSDAGHLNMPGGEVYTAPLEAETEGHVRFTFPAVYQGVEVEDVRLWFEAGKVVKATAVKGEAFLHSVLDRDEGARRLGEFAIGTNPGITEFTRNTLFDEKIQGTAHMALGFSIEEAGGVNRSQIHWDMVCDLRQHGQIYADDRLIYENGEFVIDFE